MWIPDSPRSFDLFVSHFLCCLCFVESARASDESDKLATLSDAVTPFIYHHITLSSNKNLKGPYTSLRTFSRAQFVRVMGGTAKAKEIIILDDNVFPIPYFLPEWPTQQSRWPIVTCFPSGQE